MGNKHASPSLWIILVFKLDTFDKIFDIGAVILDTLFKIGESLFVATFSFSPSGITGLGHDLGRCDVSYVDCLGIGVAVGSVISTAVAGTVLGIAKVPAIVVENTDRTTAPFIPATRDETSAAMAAFW